MIREAHSKDAINLAALSIQVWLETYALEGIRAEYANYVLTTFTKDYFEDLIQQPQYRLFISEEDQVLQGYALVNLDSHFKTKKNGFEIDKLYVHSKFKGQGLARQLLSEVATNCGERFWLYTWVENESNAFYQHLGFTQIGQLSFEFSHWLIENNVYAFNYKQQ
ncbi:MAG: GNAT family N-acetyltransferase [Oceanospirillaceae bacterium]|nr:GNAT family N-acetyltransferase [Oceanospirillaceae bacterium]